LFDKPINKKMKLYSIIILSVTLSVFSCDESGKSVNQQNQNQTPEVFNESELEQEISSVSKRYWDDIVSKLYDEALENNAKLHKLDDDINEMHHITNDSLKLYRKYASTNSNYWSTANNYIEQLSDSLLRISSKEFFKQFEIAYSHKILKHKAVLDTINKRSVLLNDKLIIMKLLISASMMENYQSNELPDIETMRRLVSEYDKLIKETTEFTEIVK